MSILPKEEDMNKWNKVADNKPLPGQYVVFYDRYRQIIGLMPYVVAKRHIDDYWETCGYDFTMTDFHYWMYLEDIPKIEKKNIFCPECCGSLVSCADPSDPGKSKCLDCTKEFWIRKN
jgi:hypothetical protein